jgi:hypothetical protein
MRSKEGYQNAFEKLTFLIETVPGKYVGRVWLLRGIIGTILGHD